MTAPIQDHSQTRDLHRWVRLAFIVALLALVGWLGWRALRSGLSARAALNDLDRLQATMAQPSLDALPRVQADIVSLETHLKEVRAAAGPFLRLTPSLGWAPRFGPDLVLAPQLLDMAVELSTAGRIAVDSLAPIGELVSGGGGLDALPQAVDALQAAQPEMAQASRHLARAAELRATMPPLTEPRLAGQVAKLDALLPLAQDGLELAQVAPALLGIDGPHTYLLLAQNSHELRATGGFISGAGHVTLDHGKILDLTLMDSYAVDNYDQPHPAPPAPLRKYMSAGLWVLRDSNWSPDFPEAADVARAFYAQDRGVETDGAIALDLEAVRQLVDALGPLQVPDIPELITGDNALTWMKAEWQSPSASDGLVTGDVGWWESRKDFMSDLVKAALAKVQGGADVDMAGLARTLYGALEARHIQASFDDPTVAAVLAGHAWDGGLRPPEASDFLVVIDSNLGFNKANLAVEQRIDYQVEATGAGLVATLEVLYTHTAPLGAETLCDRSPRYGKTYDDMAYRCYWDYLRVYTPADSELLTAEGLDDVASEAGERGTTVVAGDFVLRPGEQHTIMLRYRLPATVPVEPYRLLVRKQAGTLGHPLSVTMGSCHEETTLVTDFYFQCPQTSP